MSESPSQPRVKRQKLDKVGRFAALEKLKSLKGQKNKYEVNDKVDSVYDIVDESEFAKKAKEKYGDDWIEDDGTGYLEDGRDFFEDEDDYSGDESVRKLKDKNPKKRSRDIEKPVKGKGSIRSLFSNAIPKKKKEVEVKLEEDDVLADILGEIDSNKPRHNNHVETNTMDPIRNKTGKERSEAAIVKEYMQNFVNNIKKRDTPTADQEGGSDDEMIDRILKPKRKDFVQSEENITIAQEKVQDALPDEAEEQASKTLISPNKTKIKTPEFETTLNHDDAETFNDMDLSILNDDEHQFEEGKIKIKVVDKSKTDPKSIRVVDDTEMLLTNWDNICKMDNFEEEMEAAIDSEEPTNNEENLKIWYWDAWEDSQKRPGQIFLFGKVKGNNGEYKSTCIHIENIERVLYLLPREYVI